MSYRTRCIRCHGSGKEWKLEGRKSGQVKCSRCGGSGIVTDIRGVLTLDQAEALGWWPVPSWPDFGRPGQCRACGKPLAGRRTKWCGERVCEISWWNRLYQGVHWTKRYLVVARGCACECCGEVFEKPLRDGGPVYPLPGKLSVDHRQPLADGGTDTPGNCQLLCRPCHARKTRRENISRARARRGD